MGGPEAAANVQRIRDVFERVWNKWDWSPAREYYHENIVVHGIANLPPIVGFKAWGAVFEDLHRAYPDLHFKIEDIMGAGDRVSIRFTFTGTHHGEFMGVPPTGRPIAITQLMFVRLENGLAVEIWPLPDLMAMMRQLGVAPPKALMAVMRGVRRLQYRLRGLGPAPHAGSPPGTSKISPLSSGRMSRAVSPIAGACSHQDLSLLAERSGCPGPREAARRATAEYRAGSG